MTTLILFQVKKNTYTKNEEYVSKEHKTVRIMNANRLTEVLMTGVSIFTNKMTINHITNMDISGEIQRRIIQAK